MKTPEEIAKFYSGLFSDVGKENIREKAFISGYIWAKSWTETQNELPEYNEVVNVRFKSHQDEILTCSATLQKVTRHFGKDSPIDEKWFVYPSFGNEINVFEWREI